MRQDLFGERMAAVEELAPMGKIVLMVLERRAQGTESGGRTQEFAEVTVVEEKAMVVKAVRFGVVETVRTLTRVGKLKMFAELDEDVGQRERKKLVHLTSQRLEYHLTP